MEFIKIKSLMYWLLVGSLEHWEKALEERVWGVNEKRKYMWDKISAGDILFFYVTRPVKGVIGVGRVLEKFEGKEPLWPREVEEGRVIWKYRVRFETVYSLPLAQWEKRKIPLAGLKVFFSSGLNPLDDYAVRRLLEKMESEWGVKLPLP